MNYPITLPYVPGNPRTYPGHADQNGWGLGDINYLPNVPGGSQQPWWTAHSSAELTPGNVAASPGGFLYGGQQNPGYGGNTGYNANGFTGQFAGGFNPTTGTYPATSGTSSNAGIPNDISVLRNPKNPTIDSNISGLLSKWSGVNNSPEVDQYINAFNDSQGAANRNFNREDQVLGGYYDGTTDAQRAQLRDQRAAAVRGSADRALQYVTRDLKSTALQRGGGGSSYLTKLGLDKSADIEQQVAMDNANAQRGDYETGLKERLGLIGQRTQRLDDLQKRLLVPYQTRLGALQAGMATLDPLSRLDLQNSFYGLKKPAYLDYSMNYVPNMGGFNGGYNSGGGYSGGYPSRSGGAVGNRLPYNPQVGVTAQNWRQRAQEMFGGSGGNFDHGPLGYDSNGYPVQFRPGTVPDWSNQGSDYSGVTGANDPYQSNTTYDYVGDYPGN